MWVRPTFAAIYAILKNPAYAGAYAYGKQHRIHLPGDAHKVVTHWGGEEDNGATCFWH